MSRCVFTLGPPVLFEASVDVLNDEFFVCTNLNSVGSA